MRACFRSAMAVVFAFLVVWCGFAHAEQKRLIIGDKAPDIEVLEWIKGEPFKGYEKGQVYLMEFGATWCAPCKKIIPVLSRLNEGYGDKLSVYSFFIQENLDGSTEPTYLDRVRQYVANEAHQINYNVGVDDPTGKLDKAWKKAVDHSGVPCGFIVDKEGRLAWFGRFGPDMATALAQVINDEYDLEAATAAHREKVELMVPYEASKPLLVDGNGGEATDFMFRSVLSQWKPGSIKRYTGYNRDFILDGRSRLQLIGHPLIRLYDLAYNDREPKGPPRGGQDTSYGELWPELILEVSDPEPFGDYFGSAKEKTVAHYNYSLIVPEEHGNSEFLQSAMQRDLQNYFGYQVSVEQRDMPAWHLKAKRKSRKLLKQARENSETPDENHPMKSVANNIAHYFHRYYRKDGPVTVVNSTDLEVDVNVAVFAAMHEVRKQGVEAINAALESYGLYLEKGTHNLRTVVIRDPEPSSAASVALSKKSQ